MNLHILDSDALNIHHHQHAHLFLESVMNASRQHPWEHLQSVMYTSTVIGHDIIVHGGTDYVTY